MASGVCWINGVKLTVAAVTSRTFTASKDTYVDFQDNGDGTANITYTEVANNASSPALGNSGTTANTIRNAIVITGATFIATGNNSNPLNPTLNAINQGDTFATLPVASSQNYSVTDSLGNLIYPTSASGQMIGYQQRVSNFTTTSVSNTIVDVTGLQITFIVPVGPNRKVRLIALCPYMTTSQGTSVSTLAIFLRSGSTTLMDNADNRGVASTTALAPLQTITTLTLAPGTYTIKVSIAQSAATAATLTLGAALTTPAFVSAEML